MLYYNHGDAKAAHGDFLIHTITVIYVLIE